MQFALLSAVILLLVLATFTQGLPRSIAELMAFILLAVLAHRRYGASARNSVH